MHCIRRPLSWLLSLILVFLPLLPAQAAMIGNDQMLDPAQDRLQEFLARETTQAQLLALGVDPEWASERASRLTDSELARINQGLDKLDAGGTSVLGALLVIFIVFVITDVLGATDIFPFIRPIR